MSKISKNAASVVLFAALASSAQAFTQSNLVLLDEAQGYELVETIASTSGDVTLYEYVEFTTLVTTVDGPVPRPALTANGEFSEPGSGTPTGNVGYAITIGNSTAPIELFAVSFIDPGWPASSAPEGFASQIFTENQWNAGTVNLGFAETPSDSLGSFDTIFGTVDNMGVIFTALNEGGAGSLSSADSDPFAGDVNVSSSLIRFVRHGAAASEFIAVSPGGQIVAGSLVPEPGTAVLSLLGIAGLIRRRR